MINKNELLIVAISVSMLILFSFYFFALFFNMPLCIWNNFSNARAILLFDLDSYTSFARQYINNLKICSYVGKTIIKMKKQVMQLFATLVALLEY